MNSKSLRQIPEEVAKQQFLRLTNEEFQWWLRLPIINLLWRRDFLRFAISLDFLIGQLLEALLCINSLERGDAQTGFEDMVAQLSIKPSDLVQRLERAVSLRDFYRSEEEVRHLVRETIQLGTKRFGEECPWLTKTKEPLRCRDSLLHPCPERLVLLAQELASSYTVSDQVLAVGISESAAKGLADETSDLDLQVICTSIPDEGSRTSLTCGLADDVNDIQFSTNLCDQFFVKGTFVDVRYWTLADRGTGSVMFDF